MFFHDDSNEPPSLPYCKGCTSFDTGRVKYLVTTDFLIMNYVQHQNDFHGFSPSPSDIKEDMVLKISMPNATKIITKLCALGRFKKEDNPKHAISFLVSITPEGRACLECYRNPDETTECQIDMFNLTPDIIK